MVQTAVGSTPTCSYPPVDGLAGITEMHPGNYFLYGQWLCQDIVQLLSPLVLDTMQASISACSQEQVAVRVTATVIAAYPERNELVIGKPWRDYGR